MVTDKNIIGLAVIDKYDMYKQIMYQDNCQERTECNVTIQTFEQYVEDNVEWLRNNYVNGPR